MPKVKDLGVTVVPEQFGPMGIGRGGGCYPTYICTDCTYQPYSICGTTPQQQVGAARGGGCTDCTTQQFSICGTSPGGGCTDCTTQQFSICGTSPGPCTDCTKIPFSICGTSPGGCSDCTTQQFSICGTTPGPCTDCTTQQFSICGTSPVVQACRQCSWSPMVACRFQTQNFTPCGGGTWETPCGGSFDWRAGGLTQQGINEIRKQLQAQLEALDEAEKRLGPQTTEEVDAREKELNAELDKLKTVRANLKKNK